MKITSVKVTPLYVPYEGPLMWAWGSFSGCRRILVEISTDDGFTGVGESTGDVTRLAALEGCRHLLLGQDPFHTEQIRWMVCPPSLSLFYGNAYLHAYAAIETACLDIQGQVLGRPIHDLLGGKRRDHVPLTGYMMPHTASDPGAYPEHMVAYARDIVGRHAFHTLKLKAGILPPNVEIETIAALRSEFPGHFLRMDANSVWSLGTAMRVARALEPYDLEYLEDPTWGVRGMARLNAKCPWLPLATNMVVFGFEDLAAGTLLNVVDVLLFDAHWYGGPRAIEQLARFCTSLNFDIGMHTNGELGVSMAMVLQLGAILPGLTHSIDALYFHLEDDILEGGKLAYVDGGINVPSGPGLGVRVDHDKVAQYHEEYLKEGLEPYAAGSSGDTPTGYGGTTGSPKW